MPSAIPMPYLIIYLEHGALWHKTGLTTIWKNKVIKFPLKPNNKPNNNTDKNNILRFLLTITPKQSNEKRRKYKEKDKENVNVCIKKRGRVNT